MLDNSTGLTWETKTTDGGLHDMLNTYTWYDSSAANPGSQVTGSCIGNPGGDTDKFVAVINAEQLCGHTDWRLPSLGELQGLVVTGSYPTIDTAYFPNTPGGSFWSGSSYVPAPSTAWLVAFWDGSTHTEFKNYSHYVRLVRGGP